MQVEQHECAHRPCRCVVSTGDSWCLPQCEEAAGQDSEAAACECGHADCERLIGAQEGMAAA